MFKKEISTAPKARLKSSVQRALRQSLADTYPLLVPHLDVVLPRKASLSAMKLPDRATLYLLEAVPLFFQTDGSPPPPLLPHLRLVHRFPHAFPCIRVDRGAIRFILSGATLMAPGLTSPGGRLPRPTDAKSDVDTNADASADTSADTSANAGANAGANANADVDANADANAAADVDTAAVAGVDDDGHWSRELEKGEPVVVMAEGKEEACAVGVLAMGTRDIRDKGKGPVVEEAHFLGDGLWNMLTD